MQTRVNGGITTNQVLSGSLLFFKIAGAFAYTISDGTVTLDSEVIGQSTPVTTYFLVGENFPVPRSLAEHTLRALAERCSIEQISVIGDPGEETELHIAVSGTAFGWLDVNGAIDIAAMQAAVAAVGATIDVPTTSGGAVGDQTEPPQEATVSTTVTITNVPFVLA